MIKSPAPRVVGSALVAGQFLLLALIVLLPNGDFWSAASWLVGVATVLCFIGVTTVVAAALHLGRGLTAMPLPNQHNELRTTGVYRWVRHPIYSGLIAFSVGRTILSGNVVTVVLCGALIVLLWFKSHWEEQQLRKRYSAYDDYARTTGRLVPRLRRSSISGA